MTAGRLTRRSLLTATAAAVAGAASRPGSVLAALAGPPPAVLRDQLVGALGAGERKIELAHGADLLGVRWQAPSGAHLQLSFLGGDGRWSPWLSAGATGHGPDQPARSGGIVGEPIWTGGARAVRLRTSRALSGVRLALVDVSGGVGAHRAALAAGRSAIGSVAQAASLPRAEPVLQAGPGQPPIIARRAWARGAAHPLLVPAYGSVQLAFVHHTENPNGYLPGEVPAMLRAIFAFHRYVHGWNDIGYNFVIDAFGRIFEARAGGIDEPVVGAQAGGYNLVSTGVAVLGSFSSGPISPAAKRALAQLLAWKLALHGVSAAGRVTVRVNPAGAIYSRYPANARVSLPRIAGHRDADATDCPGDALYHELPGIRASVLRLAPRPVRATIALSGPAPVQTPPTQPAPGQPPPVPQPPAGASEGLAGTLAFLDGTPIAGASVAIQQISLARRGELVGEQTLALLATDAQGRWSLPSSVTRGVATGIVLRALYAGGGAGGAGAAVSEPLALAAAAFSPPAAPAPSPQAAAPPAS